MRLLEAQAEAEQGPAPQARNQITADWLIDPAKTLVLVLTYPHGMVPVELVSWLNQRFPWENFIGINKQDSPLIVTRNWCVQNVILANPQYDHVLLLDNDVRPDWQADAMFQTPADIVACRWDHDNHWHADPQAIHLSMCLVKRELFERVGAPWFDFVLSDDRLTIENCECGYFKKKAHAAGFSTANAGWCNHTSARSWCSR